MPGEAPEASRVCVLPCTPHSPRVSSPSPLPVSRRVVVPSLPGILTEPAHNATPAFCYLPPRALTPSHLLSHLPVSLPTHSHFPLLTPNPPIFTFLIHLHVQSHNLSLKHLQSTQGEELCLPRPTCPCLSQQHPHAPASRSSRGGTLLLPMSMRLHKIHLHPHHC